MADSPLLLRTESVRQQLFQWAHAGPVVDEQCGAAVLEENLPAASARHEYVATRVTAGEGD